MKVFSGTEFLSKIGKTGLYLCGCKDTGIMERKHSNKLEIWAGNLVIGLGKLALAAYFVTMYIRCLAI